MIGGLVGRAGSKTRRRALRSMSALVVPPRLRAFRCDRSRGQPSRVTTKGPMGSREDMILFVEERLGFTPTAETKFWWETGAASLDVIAFWEEFAEHYGVDPVDAGEGYDYGDGDGGLGEALEHLWNRITFRPVPKAKHFTIDHLVQVANRKKWFDPELEY